MRRVLTVCQLFLLMSTPLPQASYLAILLGRSAGFHILLLFCLYAASDVVAMLAVMTAVRWLGPRGHRALTRLGRPGRWAERELQRAETLSQSALSLPALFVGGVVNLYLVAAIAGLGNISRRKAMSAGIAGDLTQFISTVALGGALARALPFPAAEWLILMIAPLVVGGLPAVLRLGRRGSRIPWLARWTTVAPVLARSKSRDGR